jgi:hypothetical protein
LGSAEVGLFWGQKRLWRVADPPPAEFNGSVDVQQKSVRNWPPQQNPTKPWGVQPERAHSVVRGRGEVENGQAERCRVSSPFDCLPGAGALGVDGETEAERLAVSYDQEVDAVVIEPVLVYEYIVVNDTGELRRYRAARRLW